MRVWLNAEGVASEVGEMERLLLECTFGPLSIGGFDEVMLPLSSRLSLFLIILVFLDHLVPCVSTRTHLFN